MVTFAKDFIIRQDSQPVKVLRLDPRRVKPFMKRLRCRFPNSRWSISNRFPLGGGD